jgi:hypothetical protein
MPNFRQPDKSVSRAFVQNGIYVGNVTRIDEASQRIYVEIPRYVAGFEFGPLNVACPDLPAVGDSVACSFLENKQEDVMVLGVIKNASSDVLVTPVVATSTSRPALPRVGAIIYETDTEDSFVWSGSAWVAFGTDGPQGPQGTTGPQGATGAQGATGSQGATGAAGTNGTNGTNGDWSTAQTLNTQTGTSYTVQSSDVGKLITLTNGSPVALTVNTGLGLSAGQRIDLFQNGAGQVTVGGTATLRSTPTLKLRAQYSAATLICLGGDVFALVGDLAAS